MSHVFYFTHITLLYFHFLKSQHRCHNPGQLSSFPYLQFGNAFSHWFFDCCFKRAGEKQNKKGLGKSQQMALESSGDGRKIPLTHRKAAGVRLGSEETWQAKKEAAAARLVLSSLVSYQTESLGNYFPLLHMSLPLPLSFISCFSNPYLISCFSVFKLPHKGIQAADVGIAMVSVPSDGKGLTKTDPEKSNITEQKKPDCFTRKNAKLQK